jgi:hypothetical protein
MGRLRNYPSGARSTFQVKHPTGLSSEISHTISSTKAQARRSENNGGKLPGDKKKEQKETASKRKMLREKLLKFLSRVPVFVYLTDLRDEALQQVITSLDPRLFERVTGLAMANFVAIKEACSVWQLPEPRDDSLPSMPPTQPH